MEKIQQEAVIDKTGIKILISDFAIKLLDLHLKYNVL